MEHKKYGQVEFGLDIVNIIEESIQDLAKLGVTDLLQRSDNLHPQ